MFGPIARRNWPEVGAWSYGISALVVAILGLSTLVHEMAHAIVANRAGLKITAINVTFWGGATHLATTSPTPAARALISGAGPVSNLILAAISYFLWQFPTQWSIWWALLAVTTFVNLFVGLLNLFPALPLDGGGLVEAWVWAVKKDQHVAARITARISQVLGVLLGLSPLIWIALTRQKLDMVLIIWCIILGAAMFSTGTAIRQRPRSRKISTEIFMTARALPSHAMMSQLPERIASLAKAELPPYPDQPIVVLREANGSITGWVDPVAAAQVPKSLAASTPLTSVSVSITPEAVVAGMIRNSDAWVNLLSNLPHDLPGLIIVDDGSTGMPGDVLGAVNIERLVAELVARDR